MLSDHQSVWLRKLYALARWTKYATPKEPAPSIRAIAQRIDTQYSSACRTYLASLIGTVLESPNNDGYVINTKELLLILCDDVLFSMDYRIIEEESTVFINDLEVRGDATNNL